MPESSGYHGKSFDENIEILLDEIVLAEQWGRPSLLLAVHKSTFGQEKAEKALKGRLAEKGFAVRRIVFNETHSDIAQLLRVDSPQTKSVVFISNLDGGGGRDGREAYRGLNLHREQLVEESVKAVFWLTVNEAANLPRYAPDFWAFRHRVVEFVSQRAIGKVRLPVGVLAWDMPHSPDPFESPRSGIQARDVLLRQLPESMEALSTRIELQTSIAHLHWTLGELEEATARFEAGLDLAGDHPLPGEKASLLNGTGIILYEQHQLDEALDRFEQGLRFRSSSRALLINLSAAQCVLGRIQEAIDLGQKAIRASPGDGDTWSRLAYIYHAAGRPDEAIRCLTKAIELAPWTGAHHMALAVIYATMDRSEEANRHLAMAAPGGKGGDSAYLQVVAAAVRGDTPKSVDMLKAAIQGGEISPVSVGRDLNLNLLLSSEDLARAAAAAEDRQVG